LQDGAGVGGVSEERASFLKKEAKNVLDSGPRVVAPARANLAKVFRVIFQKKRSASSF
jgi:predicted NodU family carbamoyl transferase